MTCTSAKLVWDKTSGQYKEVCQAVKRCDTLVGQGSSSQCAHFVLAKEIKPLDKTIYQQRDISWAGKDYSGLSLYKYYPVEWLQPTLRNDQYVLAYKAKNGETKPIDGKDFYPVSICQAFPEKDSPFKQKLASSYYSGISNICEKEDKEQCQCSYTKITYTSGGQTQTRWWDKAEENPPLTTCDQERDKDCQDRPLKASKVQQVLGLENYCLEPDPSKPKEVEACLTWWPGVAVGKEDIYEQHPEAGYQAALGQDWYVSKEKASWEESVNSSNADIKGTRCENSNNNACPDTYLDCRSHSSGGIISMSTDMNIVWPVGGEDYTDHAIAEICFDNKNVPESAVEKIYLGENDFALDHDNEDPSCSLAWDCNKKTSSKSINLTPSNWSNSTDCKDNDADNPFNVNVISWSPLCLKFDYHDSSGRYGAFLLKQFRIKYWSGAEEIVKVADLNDGNMAKAWTNRFYEYEDKDACEKKSSSCWKNKLPSCGADGSNCSKSQASFAWGAMSQAPADTYYHSSSQYAPSHLYTYSNNQPELKNLFAKTYLRYSLDASTKTYPNPDTGWDITSQSSPSDSPKTAAVGSDNSEGSDLMTINNTSKGNIAPPGATSYMAILKFYAWADKNHMPIREVVVDWGDDSFPSGLYSGIKGKNRRRYCISDPNDPNTQGWGGSADACTQGYFQFVHTYICQAGGAGYDKNTNKCSFTPKVYVKDNWGWCNDGNYVGDISCWTDGHGQPYDGQIILSPASD